MKARILVATGSLLLMVAGPSGALTVEDCQLWIQQAEGEAGRVTIGGDESAELRRRLLDQLDQAARAGREQELSGSLDKVTKFQKQARALASGGKVSAVEGERLFTIGEAARRCLERVRQGE